MDVDEALSWGRRVLFGKSEYPARDAAVLLSHVLKCTTAHLYLHPENRLTPENFQEYSSYLARRALKEPLAYITGVKEFMGFEFVVDKRVLIPRPETEILVERALSAIDCMIGASPQEPIRVWDVCCGSGAVGLSILKLISKFDEGFRQSSPKTRVILTDISEKALDVAKENAARLKVEGQAEFSLGDGLKPAKGLGLVGKVDLIVTNPPYIAKEALSSLDEEIRDYEPLLALDGGPQGMDFVKDILAGAPFVLAPYGMLLMEIGHDQADKCHEILKLWQQTPRMDAARAGRSLAFWDKWWFVPDYAGKKRILAARVRPGELCEAKW